MYYLFIFPAKEWVKTIDGDEVSGANLNFSLVPICIINIFKYASSCFSLVVVVVTLRKWIYVGSKQLM